MPNYFSSEAPQVAVLARLKVATARKEAVRVAKPAVFVVRSTAGPTFQWELRRYGAVVIRRSEAQLADHDEVLAAGRAELDRVGAAPV